MRTFTGAVGLIAAGALVAGCSTGARTTSTPEPTLATTVPAGGELSVAVTDALPTAGWDPVTAPDSTVRTLGPLVMATLLRTANDGAAPEPGLATTATPDSTATSWTVTMPPSLAFADGSRLTARDMAFALSEAAKQPTLTGRFGADARGTFFVSATATDAQTLVVKLRAPNALLDRTVLAAPEFGCIKENYAGLERAEYYKAPVACGPYSAAPLTRRATELVLSRNASYVAANRVGADRISVVQLGANEADDSFVAGGGDIVIDPRAVPGSATATSVAPTTPVANSSAASATATTSEPLVVASSAPGAVRALVFRNRPPTRDANLRIAVQSSLSLATVVAADPGSVAANAGLVPPTWPGSITRAVTAPDPALAATATSLLDEDARTFTVLVRAGDAEGLAQAEVIAQQVKAAGIDARVNPVSTTRYLGALASGGFQAAVVTVAPRVALAADVTRQWAITGGLGGGWPVAEGASNYPLQLSLPVLGQTAAKGSTDFASATLDPLQVLPLSARPHRVLAGPIARNGLVVRWDGSVPLERVVLRTVVPLG